MSSDDERRCREAGCGVLPQLILPSGWCYSHDPDLAEERAERSRRGGEMTRRRYQGKQLPPDEIGELEDSEDAKRILHLVATAVAGGRLSASQGSAIERLVRTWLSANTAHLSETRLKQLEASVAELTAPGRRATMRKV